MLGDIIAGMIEATGNVIFTLLPARIGWHFLGALGVGMAAASAAAQWPEGFPPAAAAVLGTLAIYPIGTILYCLARRDAREARTDRTHKDPGSNAM